jgi:RNA polymerase sigma-70 factor, ECF subfamily
MRLDSITVAAKAVRARPQSSQSAWNTRPRRCSVRPSMSASTGERTSADEFALVSRLRAGDERAFEDIVERYYASMLAVARGYVRSRAVAEEVVQDAWLAVLKGLDRFEGRSSLRTWVLRIVANKAQTRAVREARMVPMSSIEPEGAEPTVEPARFRGPGDPFPGHWWTYPTDWRTLPETQLYSEETINVVRDTIEGLPDMQRTVITLRDVVGCESDEVCESLGISEGNQRVLLHRARARVRAALERHLDG